MPHFRLILKVCLQNIVTTCQSRRQCYMHFERWYDWGHSNSPIILSMTSVYGLFTPEILYCWLNCISMTSNMHEEAKRKFMSGILMYDDKTSQWSTSLASLNMLNSDYCHHKFICWKSSVYRINGLMMKAVVHVSDMKKIQAATFR